VTLERLLVLEAEAALLARHLLVFVHLEVGDEEGSRGRIVALVAEQ